MDTPVRVCHVDTDVAFAGRILDALGADDRRF